MSNLKDLKPGDRVRMTPEAIAANLHGPLNRRTGIFKKHEKVPDYVTGPCIRVLRDGVKSSSVYSIKFWQKMTDEEILEQANYIAVEQAAKLYVKAYLEDKDSLVTILAHDKLINAVKVSNK